MKRFVLLAIFMLLALVVFTSCDTNDNSQPVSSIPTATSGDSLARKMVIQRYRYLNDANKYGYFYGFIQGVDHPVIEYVVQGSVFPVSDLVTPPNYQETCHSSGSGACAVVLDKQQPDGTYGTNGTAMFGWTADGKYFEWDGPYAYSSQPLSFEGKMKVVGCKTGIPGC